MIITSENINETGEEVLDKVREAVDAKEGWITVEKVRKAKDRKIIMSCRTKEDRDKIKEKVEKAGKHLICEEVQNKDPLMIIKDVLAAHSDEVIISAIRKQNKSIFQNLKASEDRIIVKYRRRARNPLMTHIVVTTSPLLWKRVTDRGILYIDMQRAKVEDQSPLTQCTRCLAYGHGKRFCKRTEDLCGYCGGPHLRNQCDHREAGAPPHCINCEIAKGEHQEHDAFSSACPVRKRWDILARSSIAYC